MPVEALYAGIKYHINDGFWNRQILHFALKTHIFANFAKIEDITK